MAGDWIKVEHSTLDKPEVTLFAEMLGVEVDHGLGILVRFWVWFDRNSCNGRVTHVSRKSIDTIMHYAGFSSAIESVKWLEFDDEKRTARIPNFERHNGTPAKSRALANVRVKRHRNAMVTPKKRSTVTKTLTEKRREYIKPSTESYPKTKQATERPKTGHKNGLESQKLASYAAWMTDEAAALSKGESLGLKPNAGESWPAFRNRIIQAEARRTAGTSPH